MLMTIGIIALIAVVVGFIGVSLFDAFRPDPSTRQTPRGEQRDPATCDHEWRTWDSGTCMTGYSSSRRPRPPRGMGCRVLSPLRRQGVSLHRFVRLPFRMRGHL